MAEVEVEVETYPETDNQPPSESSEPNEESSPSLNNNNIGEEEPPKPVEVEPRQVMNQVIQDVETAGRTSLHAIEQDIPISGEIHVPDENPDRLQLVLDLLGASGFKVAGDKQVNGKYVLIRASTSYIYLAD